MTPKKSLCISLSLSGVLKHYIDFKIHSYDFTIISAPSSSKQHLLSLIFSIRPSPDIRLTLNHSSWVWVPDWSWSGLEGKGSGPVPGGAHCCKEAALQWRGWDPSGEVEPQKRCWGGRSALPGETPLRSLEGCAPTPANTDKAGSVSLLRVEGCVVMLDMFKKMSYRVFLWVGGLGGDDGVKAGGWQRTEFLPHGSDLQQSSERWRKNKLMIIKGGLNNTRVAEHCTLTKAFTLSEKNWYIWGNKELIKKNTNHIRETNV